MFGLPLEFTSPLLLSALVILPAIWWLLRLTPPKPQVEVFPPTRILARLKDSEETPAQSPWWLTLIRLLMAGLFIAAMAGPILNPQENLISETGSTLIVVDDGWASASDWENRKNTARSILDQAQDTGSTIILQSTTGQEAWTNQPLTPEAARSLLEAANPQPLEPNHALAARQIEEAVKTNKPENILFLSDGLKRAGTDQLFSSTNTDDTKRNIFIPNQESLIVLETIRNEPKQLIGNLVRSKPTGPLEVSVLAKDEANLTIARTKAIFGTGENRTEFILDEPVELRNQITRLELEGAVHAAAVQLLDEGNQRRLVGLISGEKFDQSQPLLSPLYYISKALEPFSDLRRSDDANVAVSVPDLINQGISAIMLADVGNLPTETTEQLEKWVENGGMLVRFAGPRLGGTVDKSLLPVDIRPGDRSLGGALSWETPKPLAPFERESPFFGIEKPRDVLVNKQLLALQEVDLEQKTWATLEDGTPLVTAEALGGGWVVLFHVGSDAEWSNLPLSGTFVEMLRRVVNLSRSASNSRVSDADLVLPPLRVLDASGSFIPPSINVKNLVLKTGEVKSVSRENPPGIYGTDDGFEALNLFEEETTLTELTASDLGQGFVEQAYLSGKRFELKHILFVIAALLLIADCLAVLWMSGALKTGKLRQASAKAAIIAFAFALPFMVSPTSSLAQDQTIDFSAALQTRLAYVVTGIEDVDRISKAGLTGLTEYITSRTALEPGPPIGLDMSTDELSFYSLIYWPVDPGAELPTPETMARVDAFMKEGGSILFDTRDQISGAFGGTASSAAAQTLQRILEGLDIPPLEPVPDDHVLTKSFYLLDTFPGRFAGGDLWVEVSEADADFEGRPARVGDGVSSIMITSNDFAGAWAVDQSLRPLLPTIPPDPSQRNYAFRSGVNLIMYALTGNYKSDQVHLPELLERLGQ